MNCNLGIHEELKSMGEVICQFCDEQIADFVKRDNACCDKQDVINDNGTNVCRSCGIVHGYDIAREHIDFYEKQRIVRKSVYHRKYHIQNTINDISAKHRLQISVKNRTKICRIFEEIDKILANVNGDRKRMINTNFILKQLFKMFNLPHENISISKSKRTVAFYQQYWENI